MSTATLDRPVAGARSADPEPIPMGRIIGVELSKMFDTRSGFWLLTGGAILSVLATVATVVFSPHADLRYSHFAAAVGIPLSVILPMTAILAITSEWSQRSGLTTFTLVPHRGRVIRAKLVATLVVGLVTVTVAFAVGALGNLLGSALVGVDAHWNISVADALLIFLGDGLGMLMGFTLGVLIRNSAGAIVAYFVYALVLPAAFGALAAAQSWFANAQGWFDFQFSSTRLYGGPMSGTDWGHLATSGLIWLVLPMAVGLWTLMRSEVK